MRSSKFGPALGALAFAASLAGCSPQDALAPTPLIYLASGVGGVAEAPPSMGNEDLVYVTDRAPITDPTTGALSYGAGRSRFLSFGTVGVDITSPTASGETGRLKLGAVTEVGRFPDAPYPTQRTPKGQRRAPEAVAAHESAVAELQGEIRRRLAKTQRKEVVLFIHGYANTFDDAVRTTGNLCHDLGDFVCVVLSWPAGGKGLFLGYNVDTASSEFAVADMKKAIRAISETEGVRAIHLIAHSRGTGVLTSALQELIIEAYASRSSVSQQLKVKNVVLFAPDIDIDVAAQKLSGLISDPDAHFGPRKNPEGVFPQGGLHVTVYSSPDDRALGLSDFIYGGERLGQQDLDRPDVTAFGQDAGREGLFTFIEVHGRTDRFGHGYFLSNPAVSSDLVATIRYGLKPGDPGRPLVNIAGPFWRLGPADTQQSASAQ